MHTRLAAAMAPVALSTQGFVTYLQGLFGPLFLGIVAIFFLFTRGITRFVQFIVLAVAIAVIFYTPGIVHALATGTANTLRRHYRSNPMHRTQDALPRFGHQLLKQQITKLRK